MSEHIDQPYPSEEPAEEYLTPEQQDWALIEAAVSWCALHQLQTCKPILNGCGLLDQQRQAFARLRGE